MQTATQKEQTVEFNGNEVICVNDDEYGTLVVIKPLCEDIGISYQGQERRIKKDQRFNPINKIILLGAKPKSYLCLTLDEFQKWMDTARVNKFDEAARAPFVDYQENCRNRILECLGADVEIIPTEDVPPITGVVEHTLDFYGDRIISIKDENNDVWSPVKPICLNLGIINIHKQYEAIRNDGAIRYLLREVPSAGGSQDTFCIHIDDLPMWLGGIKSTRVEEDTKEKLILYKKECASALKSYWYTGQAINPRFASQIDLSKVTAQLDMISEKANTIDKKLDNVNNKIEESMYRQDLKIENLESELRTDHSKRLVKIYDKWTRLTPPSQHEKVWDIVKTCLEDELDPYAYFKLYEVFMDVYPQMEKRKAANLATDFRKETDVDKYQYGTVCYTAPNGTPYTTKRYERRNYDEIRDMVITWLRNKYAEAKQRPLWMD